jgi:hypothetical protein
MRLTVLFFDALRRAPHLRLPGVIDPWWSAAATSVSMLILTIPADVVVIVIVVVSALLQLLLLHSVKRSHFGSVSLEVRDIWFATIHQCRRVGSVPNHN